MQRLSVEVVSGTTACLCSLVRGPPRIPLMPAVSLIGSAT